MRASVAVCGLVAALAMCAVARGADWDHDANIERAVGEAVASYRQGGMAGMEKLVAACYASIDEPDDKDEQLLRLESCASMDFAAYRIDRSLARSEGRAITAFFSAELIMARMDRLSGFLPAPGVENEVVRAWSRAATEALERAGPL
jgi:hypothetical protein